MAAFFLAMAMNAEVQQTAHEELDRVIGRGRLPEFSDRDSLPYIDAVIKEVLRWCPVTPIGIPHRVMDEDVYNGMYIPKDSIIVANLW